MPLPSLPQDKANHVVYGAAIALSVYAIGLFIDPNHAALAGLISAVFAGTFKEAFDRWANIVAARAGLPPPHGVEFMDAAATWSGGAVVYVSASLGAWLR